MQTATYSPEDNKLRLSASSRLPKEEYLAVKAAGFHWAPKQGIFVAPMWTPDREDFAMEFADSGEIDDEDTTLCDRAEQRADRFDGYRENRLRDAHQAKAAAERIMDGVPFGQPILVGHHSERHARRDAEKIRSNTSKAVMMWDRASYWISRAAGALAHAKYKERPDVRARRIKGLESDLRKVQKNLAISEDHLARWSKEGLTHEEALAIANGGGLMLPKKEGDRPDFSGRPSAWDALTNYYPNLYAPRTLEEVVAHAKEAYPRSIERISRWIRHYENRLTYERAMLADGGGIVADKFNIEVGGRVKRRGTWLVVTKVNRRDGAIFSVTVVGHFATTIPVEEVQDYIAPGEGDAEKIKKAVALKPLCNFRQEGCEEMTSAQWKQNSKYSDSYAVRTFNAEGKDNSYGRNGATLYRHRTVWRGTYGGHKTIPVFLTDAAVKEAPAAQPVVEKVKLSADLPPSDPRPERVEKERTEFDAMRDTLKAGIHTVSAPRLFPTPPEIARSMAEAAMIREYDRVLEPSAGTGRLLDALINEASFQGIAFRQIVAVEANYALAENLRAKYISARVFAADFLTQELGEFDVILMNPPFENGSDIKHIEHAKKMLRPGGRLVAICADGPRQQKLQEWADSWEQLESGTFAGTGVRTVLFTYTAPKARTEDIPDLVIEEARPIWEAIQQGLF